MATPLDLLRVAGRIHRDLSARHSLCSLGAASGLSPFQLQRAFTRLAGESPASYQRRLRLLTAATALLRTDATVHGIARRAGFRSTEVFIRNFQKQFGCTPGRYRRQMRGHRPGGRFIQGLLRLKRMAPCLPFYRVASLPPPTRSTTMPMLSAALRTLQPQPALIIRSRVPRDEIASTIGQNLGRIVPYALGAGGTLAGQPFARYPEYGPGMITIETGMPLAAPVAGRDDIEAFTLPAGLAAVAVHGGAYDKLSETYAAFEKWIAAQGHQPSGPPWEVYVTDPAEHPDHDAWRTEVYWPVR